MRIAKLILHYNTPEITVRLCNMVENAIVIDNGSDVKFSEIMPLQPSYRFENNLGFTRNWNRIIKRIMELDEGWYDAFWLMNSDIEISMNTVNRIEYLMDEFGYAMITPSYNCWMKDCKNNGSPGVRQVKCIEFTAPVIRRDVFERIGFFNEHFSKGYGVEFDWAMRMRDAGLKMCCDDQSVFHHIGQQTINTTGTLQAYETHAKQELNSGMSRLYGDGWATVLNKELGISAFVQKGKKIAVYTTIFNNYATLYPIPKQSVEADFFCICDDQELKHEILFSVNDRDEPWRILPVNYPNSTLHPRLRAKYFKMFPWEVAALSKYETVIFIDGSIQITSPDFVRFMAEGCTSDIALYLHPQRDCIFDEAQASRSLVKYDNQAIDSQMDYYANLYPRHGGLWACGVMVRKIQSPLIRELMAKWWWENIKWTYQDQLSFPVICRMLGIHPTALEGNQYKNPFFKIHWHDDNPITKFKIHEN